LIGGHLSIVPTSPCIGRQRVDGWCWVDGSAGSTSLTLRSAA
jgi:hypothetical protein